MLEEPVGRSLPVTTARMPEAGPGDDRRPRTAPSPPGDQAQRPGRPSRQGVDVVRQVQAEGAEDRGDGAAGEPLATSLPRRRCRGNEQPEAGAHHVGRRRALGRDDLVVDEKHGDAPPGENRAGGDGPAPTAQQPGGDGDDADARRPRHAAKPASPSRARRTARGQPPVPMRHEAGRGGRGDGPPGRSPQPAPRPRFTHREGPRPRGE